MRRACSLRSEKAVSLAVSTPSVTSTTALLSAGPSRTFRIASIRLALLGGYALGVVEQLVIGYVDPQYNLIIALVVMLVLIGWRSRGELAV